MMQRVRELCRPLAPCGPCRPGQPRYDGPLGIALETGRTRLLVIGGVFMLAFAAVGGRLVDVALLKSPDTRKIGSKIAGIETEPTREILRGEITDRNGVLLAANLVTWSLYADPKMIIDPDKTAERLARMFPDLDRRDLADKLKSDKRFVWLRRHLSPREYQEVIAQGLAGIAARKDRRRVYPHGTLAAHAIGFADVDSNGISGIERHFDARLRRGEKISLSIDLRVQDVLRVELAAAMQRHHAVGAMGTILDVRSGEVLAMVSLPEFDPNDPSGAKDEARFNRVTLGTYEMGSTFKILNTAMVLDAGVATLEKQYDARAALKYGKFTINDYHGLHRWMSAAEVFQFSSNIGSAKMAMEAGTARQRAFMGRAGMLKPVPLELPEIGAPLYPRDWKPINTITISYGHGISVTPMHLVSAVGGIVFDGKRAEPTLLRRAPGEKIDYVQVVSAKTSADMRKVMRLVVEKGTGRRADAPGYFLGGKTGTADKSAGKKGYRRNTRIASFVAAFPIDAPRYAILVMIDEPKGTAETGPEATGGVVAAPVVRDVVLKAAPLLGVLPIESTSEVPPTAPAPAAPKTAPAKTAPPAKPAAKPQPKYERAATE